MTRVPQLFQLPPPPATQRTTDNSHYCLLEPDKGKTSKNWKYYKQFDVDKKHPDKGSKACCIFCQKHISVAGGTSGLQRHLEYKHRDVFVGILLEEEADNKKKANGVKKAMDIRKYGELQGSDQ
jgi:hypothetical protein